MDLKFRLAGVPVTAMIRDRSLAVSLRDEILKSLKLSFGHTYETSRMRGRRRKAPAGMRCLRESKASQKICYEVSLAWVLPTDYKGHLGAA